MTEKSELLYKLMLRKGYPEAFSRIIAIEMSTDFTADRMMSYIARNDLRPLEEVADEMLAIQSDRDRIRDKHIAEHAEAKINDLYRNLNE
ncbi:MAG: hypothetical protein IKE85_01600 [Mogibacterium sp.]|nr:hypothetical protein [Mogibacterium sp.]